MKRSHSLLLARDLGLSAPIANMIAQRAYAAPGAGWCVHRFGYCSWRDPYREGS